MARWRRDDLATIYALRCPVEGAIRYVGQTWNVKRRRWQYANASNNKGYRAVSIWVRDLIAMGTSPEFIVIETTADPDARETFWIARARELGVALLNHADGGKSNGHMMRSPASNRSRGKRPMAITALVALQHDLGNDHPVTVRYRDALRKAEERHGKETAHKMFESRINERHEARVAARKGMRMTCHGTENSNQA